MRGLRSTVTGFAAAVVMVLGGDLGTAAASPVDIQPTARTVVSPQAAAAGVCSSAALSGHGVRGALSRAEVEQQLSSLGAQRREKYGIPDKGSLGTAASDSGQQLRVDIHPAQGTSFKSASGADGSCATHSVSTQLTVQDSYTTIYTPTMYPPGGSCVELVTVYTRTVRSVSAWDWCRSVNFAASVSINSSFLSTYTNGTGAYTGRVIKTSASSNTWSAALYNYTTGRWDTLFTQSGTNQSGRTDGWDIDELYSTVGSSGRAYSCDAMAGLTFEASNISVRNNGAWSNASTANSDTHYDQPNSAFYCPTRTYQMVSAYDHWKAVG